MAQNPEYSNGVSAADVSVNKAEDARVNIAQTQEPNPMCRLAPASELISTDMAQKQEPVSNPRQVPISELVSEPLSEAWTQE